MKNNEICWESDVGKLYFYIKSQVWVLKSDNATISIISWRSTGKGPMTEVYLTTNDKKNSKEVIIEVLEKNFNIELSEPKNMDETHEKVLSMCKVLLSFVNDDSYLRCCVINLAEQFPASSAFHVYYGNGLFFGLRKSIFGKIKRIQSIPPKCIDS